MNSTEQLNILFPKSLSEVLHLQSNPSTRAVLLAGGTDLMAQWSSGAVPTPDRAISLLNIQELQSITETSDTIEVGALATHAQLRHSPLVQTHLPALAAAAATIGGRQIQERGTIAGNLANASPAGDLAPALLITDGKVVVASLSGERKMQLTDFLLDYRKIDLNPEELITRFIFPKCPEGATEMFRKIGPRAAQAISKIMAACRVKIVNQEIESIAIAIGSVAPTTIRLHKLETWLTGQTLSDKLITEAESRATAMVTPINDIRSTANYRKWLTGRLVKHFLTSQL